MSDSIGAPEVSVFIQTYQHRDFIRDAVDGVLAQRAPFDFDLVIADDCSTDGTREILEDYRARLPDRVRLLLPERNLGPSELFRRGVPELRGRYVAWLDGDDYWSDDRKLAMQVQALDENPGWAACFHDATVRDVDGKQADRRYVPLTEDATVTLTDLLRQNWVPSLSMMARGELVRELPDWVWSGLWNDWLSLVSIASHGDVGYIAQPMGVYRTHGAGLCAGLSRPSQLEEDIRFFEIVKSVLGAEHRQVIDQAVRARRCELLVEAADVPYSGAVAVLGPQHETPTYLNGRNVFQLAVGEAPAELDRRDRDGSLGAQLERYRLQAATCDPGVPHFAGGGAPTPSEPLLRLLVVGEAVPWFDRISRLQRQLEGAAAELARDEVCSVYEIRSAVGPPTPLGVRAAVREVALIPSRDGVSQAHIDLPAAGMVGDAHAVEVAGWAIGDRSQVTSIDVEVKGLAFSRLPTGISRPDLERAFPTVPGAGAAGFAGLVSLVGVGDELTLDLLVNLDDGRRSHLGSIEVHQEWRNESEQGAVPLVSVVLLPGIGERGLQEAIESLQGQSYAHWEAIVVNGSQVVAANGPVGGHPGVRYIDFEKGDGPAASRIGVDSCAGELVVFLDAGDRLLPRALEYGVDALRLRPDAAYAFGITREAADHPSMPSADGVLSASLTTVILRRTAFANPRSLPVCDRGDGKLGLDVSARLQGVEHRQPVAESRDTG
jgi:glycosyltransferase involved in cell wall biosynthesis